VTNLQDTSYMLSHAVRPERERMPACFSCHRGRVVQNRPTTLAADVCMGE
jgi:hypothetical protein